MTPYAEYLLSRPKKPALTSAQAAKPERLESAQLEIISKDFA
jgi:hypothetical protein